MSNDKFKNLIFLDTETTGVSDKDRLFQVAYIFNGEERNSLFRPPLPISVEAMETTHVTNADVEDKEPFSDSDFKKELQGILSDRNNILVAHNADFDISMLEKEGLEVSKYIDTFKVAQSLDKDSKIPSYRLQYLRYYLNLNVPNAPAHDAMGDVRVLKVLFERLFAKVLENKGGEKEALQEMIEISVKPLLFKKFSFGKYKNFFVEEIAKKDRDYLLWLLKEKEKQAQEGLRDENWIYTLKYHLGYE